MVDPLHFLILSGPTREFIDPVRYLSNASSGRQGLLLAEAALDRGHDVVMIQGPTHLKSERDFPTIDVISALDMHREAIRRHPNCDVLIAAAAVSDFRPERILPHKIKKSEVGNAERWKLELVANPDILADLRATKGPRVHIGFALESEDLVERAKEKLTRKNLDWIVANPPGTIDAEEGEYILLGMGGQKIDLGRLSKRDLAMEIVQRAEQGRPIDPEN